MFLFDAFKGSGEFPQKPQRKTIASSKGYPAIRDPQAENPTGVLSKDLGTASLLKLRRRYSNQQYTCG